ncbi:MAG TPA: hypothetical protein VKQ05_07185 [Gemmatimonadales bacterium]|nr:hypothetical protein [Gemmatimonadales bacterium]
MTSSGSSVNDALADYLAGRVTADRLAATVAAAYWSLKSEAGGRELLRPIVEIIEKAHPGIVELAESSEQPGFAVRLAERPFPKRYDADLRNAVQAVVATPAPDSRIAAPGFFSRIVRAIKKIFSA